MMPGFYEKTVPGLQDSLREHSRTGREGKVKFILGQSNLFFLRLLSVYTAKQLGVFLFLLDCLMLAPIILNLLVSIYWREEV